MPHLIASTAVPDDLLIACSEIIAGIGPGSTGHAELSDGDTMALVKRALKLADPTCRVFRARNDVKGVFRVRRYTQEELDAAASRPRAQRKPRAKTKTK